MAHPRLTPEWLAQRVRAIGAARAYVVAFSGGVDSTALLHAAAASGLGPLRAVHVNHGLHADADRWADEAHELARHCGVALDLIEVEVVRSGSIEENARRARYAALEEYLGADEALLTAHHRSDQFETVLLQLLRGAGPAGLAAMPASRPFGRGRHLRPLLEIPRRALALYLAAHDLKVVVDESNEDRRFDRNFLRHEVLPLIEMRWPGAEWGVARSARLAARADELLGDLASLDSAGGIDQDSLDMTPLAGLSAARQANAIRFWLRRDGVRPPNEARLLNFVQQLQSAAKDRHPLLEFDGQAIRAFRDRLYRGVVPAVPAPGTQARLRAGETLPLPPGLGTLEWREDSGSASGDAETLAVTFRAGGERLRLSRDGSHTPLKKLLSSNHVLPWLRDCVPLLWHAGRLVAVADLWRDEGWWSEASRAGDEIFWHGRPSPLFAEPGCANGARSSPT